MSDSITLRQLVREDWITHNRAFTKPGLHALTIHRLEVVLVGRGGIPARLLRLALHAINVLIIRNVYGVELYTTTTVGRRLNIAHHQGVILGRHAVLGDDCLVRQHVTLGEQGGAEGEHPRVGNGVEFGPGSTVAGGVTIGDGARIGAHALVLRDVPPGATVMVSASRVLPAATEKPAGGQASA